MSACFKLLFETRNGSGDRFFDFAQNDGEASAPVVAADLRGHKPHSHTFREKRFAPWPRRCAATTGPCVPRKAAEYVRPSRSHPVEDDAPKGPSSRNAGTLQQAGRWRQAASSSPTQPKPESDASQCETAAPHPAGDGGARLAPALLGTRSVRGGRPSGRRRYPARCLLFQKQPRTKLPGAVFAF